MARKRQLGDDVLEYRLGGGCVAVAGVPFLACGVAIVFCPLWSEVPWVPGLIFGGMLALMGGALVFGRKGVVIDRAQGVVTAWWGLLVPFRRRQHPLSEFHRVTVRREVRGSQKHRRTVFPVRLVGSGEARVEVDARGLPDAARRLGEDVAKFAQLPLSDSSLGEEVVREVAELDESVRERWERTGERPEVAEAPEGARSRQTVVGDALEFELPPPGLRQWHIVGLAIGLGIPVVAYFAFIQRLLTGDALSPWLKLAVGGGLIVVAMVLPVVVSVGMVVRRVFRGALLAVSPAELRVVWRGLMWDRSTAIPADELEELQIVREDMLDVGGEVTGGKRAQRFVILARSDTARAAFGAGLAREELEWIRGVAANVVSA